MGNSETVSACVSAIRLLFSLVYVSSMDKSGYLGVRSLQFCSGLFFFMVGLRHVESLCLRLCLISVVGLQGVACCVLKTDGRAWRFQPAYCEKCGI